MSPADNRQQTEKKKEREREREGKKEHRAFCLRSLPSTTTTDRTLNALPHVTQPHSPALISDQQLLQEDSASQH